MNSALFNNVAIIDVSTQRSFCFVVDGCEMYTLNEVICIDRCVSLSREQDALVFDPLMVKNRGLVVNRWILKLLVS